MGAHPKRNGLDHGCGGTKASLLAPLRAAWIPPLGLSIGFPPWAHAHAHARPRVSRNQQRARAARACMASTPATPLYAYTLRKQPLAKRNYMLQLQVCSNDRKKNRAAAGAAGAAAMRSRATCASLPFQLHVRTPATAAVTALSRHDAQPPPSPLLSPSSPVSFSASSIHRRHRH